MPIKLGNTKLDVINRTNCSPVACVTQVLAVHTASYGMWQMLHSFTVDVCAMQLTLN